MISVLSTECLPLRRCCAGRNYCKSKVKKYIGWCWISKLSRTIPFVIAKYRDFRRSSAVIRPLTWSVILDGFHHWLNLKVRCYIVGRSNEDLFFFLWSVSNCELTHIIYVKYLYDGACHVTWIIFNHHFHLVRNPTGILCNLLYQNFRLWTIITIPVSADMLLNVKQLTFPPPKKKKNVSEIYFLDDYQLNEMNFTCNMTSDSDKGSHWMKIIYIFRQRWQKNVLSKTVVTTCEKAEWRIDLKVTTSVRPIILLTLHLRFDRL